MTREQALEELREALLYDEESGHISGDWVLCELLTSLGYSDVVKAWDKIRKWYA